MILFFGYLVELKIYFFKILNGFDKYELFLKNKNVFEFYYVFLVL